MPERKKRGIPLSRNPLCTPHDLARAAGNRRPAAPAAYTIPAQDAERRGRLSAGRKPPPRGQRKKLKRTPSRHISKGAASPNTAACTADHGPRQAPFLPPAALGAGDLAGLCGVARRCRRLARRQAAQPAPGPRRRRAGGLRPTGLLSTYV